MRTYGLISKSYLYIKRSVDVVFWCFRDVTSENQKMSVGCRGIGMEASLLRKSKPSVLPHLDSETSNNKMIQSSAECSANFDTYYTMIYYHTNVLPIKHFTFTPHIVTISSHSRYSLCLHDQTRQASLLLGPSPRDSVRVEDITPKQSNAGECADHHVLLPHEALSVLLGHPCIERALCPFPFLTFEFESSVLMNGLFSLFRMLSLSLFTSLAAAAIFIAQFPLAGSLPFYNNIERATGSLASFIAAEGPVALQGVLNNIGSKGSLAPGVQAGLVVASPSKANPDC